MKKWMTVLEEDQYDWIKKLSTDVGVNGSEVVRAAIERCRNVDAGDFKQTLLQSQIKSQLDRLADERADIAQREQALKQQLKSGLVNK